MINENYTNKKEIDKNAVEEHKGETFQWRKRFVLSLLQFTSDMWEKRNKHFHGDNPTDQRLKRRQRITEKAKELYKEGEEMVMEPQRGLFHNFEQRIMGSTRSVEQWVNMVELSRKKKVENDKEFQRTMPEFFQRVRPEQQRRELHSTQGNRRAVGADSGQKGDRRVQQNIRQMFLRVNRNVRLRTSKRIHSVDSRE